MSKPTGKLIRVTTASIGAVPVERKVNNKPLSADISLSAGDVGAYGKTESDNKYQPKGNYAIKGDSYTKNESDGRYQPKGSYQPTGNYALKGDSYTKAESYNRTDIDKKIIAGSGLGYEQTWQNVTNSRAKNTVYTNSTGKPILVSISTVYTPSKGESNNIKVNNIIVAESVVSTGTQSAECLLVLVPNNGKYEYSGKNVKSWVELRK